MGFCYEFVEIALDRCVEVAEVEKERNYCRA